MCWTGCNYCNKAKKDRSCGCDAFSLELCYKHKENLGLKRCQVCGSKETETSHWVSNVRSKNYINRTTCEGLHFSKFKSSWTPNKMKKIIEIRCFDCNQISYSGFEGSFHYVTVDDYV